MGRDSWFEVKAGAGAIVEEYTTAEEFRELVGGSDLSVMSPEDILIGFEERSFDFLRGGE
jgi:hypothetical protein